MGGKFSLFSYGGRICSQILISICSSLCSIIFGIPKKDFNLVMGRVCSRFCVPCCYYSKEIKDLKKEVRLSAQTIKDKLEKAELENDGTTRRLPSEEYTLISKQLNNILERCEDKTNKFDVGDKELQVWFHADMKSEATNKFYEAFEKLMKGAGVKLTLIDKEDIGRFNNVITICNVFGREGDDLNPITGVDQTLRKRLFLIVVRQDSQKSGKALYLREMFANVVEIMFDKDKGQGGIIDIDKNKTLMSEIQQIL